MKGLILIALLAVAVPAQGQTVEKQAEPSLRVPIITFAVAASADWVSTYRFLDKNGFSKTGVVMVSPAGEITGPYVVRTHEANPALRWIHRPIPTVIAGAAMDVGVVYGWTKLMRNHRRAAAIGLYVASAFRLVLAIRNTRYLSVEMSPF